MEEHVWAVTLSASHVSNTVVPLWRGQCFIECVIIEFSGPQQAWPGRGNLSLVLGDFQSFSVC